MEDNRLKGYGYEENREDYPQYPQKKLKKSKKILGIPLAMFVILMVVMLVAAAVVYNYIYVPYNTSFIKDIIVNAPSDNGSTQNVYVSMIAHGDISDSILNCDLDGSGNCNTNTGNIILMNTDPVNAHNCTVNTSGTGVTASYLGITNPVTVQPMDNVTFRVHYDILLANVSGSYPTTTTIDCL